MSKQISTPLSRSVLYLTMAVLIAGGCMTSKLPSQLGSFPLGTREFVLRSCMVEADGSRSCPETDILVQAWYPALIEGEKLAPYILNEEVAVPALASVSGAPEFVLRNVARIETNSYRNAKVSPLQKVYPLIIFSHGYHSLRMQNTVLLEELASHGNIVLSVQHVYDAAVTVMPDGQVIPSVAPEPKTKDLDRDDALRGSWTNRRVGEDRALLAGLDLIPNDLAQAIDRDRIAVMGHSMGGSTITAVCREEAQVKACINLDGPLRGSRQEATLHRPVLFLEAEHPQYEYAEEERFYKNRIAAFKETAQNGYIYARIKGTGHLNFTDFPSVSSLPLHWFSKSAGSLSGEKSRAISFYLVKSFLDHAFAGEKVILTDEEIKKFSELEIMDQKAMVK